MKEKIMATTNKEITVRVTRKDIKNGQKGSQAACAVARAVRRATGFRMTRVTSENVAVITRGEDKMPRSDGANVRYSAKLPIRAQNFVRNFDDGVKVKPFTFKVTLKVPRKDAYIF